MKGLVSEKLVTGNTSFVSCAWGHRDPGNNKAYKKRQRFIANVPLTEELCRRCTCTKMHQRVEETVAQGKRKGVRRSVVAGEYPEEFCRPFAQLIRRHVCVCNT